MKKILLIHHSGNIGGAGVSLYHIAKSLDSMSEKYDVQVYCPIDPPDLNDFLNKSQIKTIKANHAPYIFNHFSGGEKSIFSPYIIKNIINIVRKKNWDEIKNVIEGVNPDIVAVNSMTLCWLGSLISNMGIKTVCFHRETYTKGMFGVRTNYIKNCLRRDFNAVVFISNNDLQETEPIKGMAQVITDKVNFDEYTNNHKMKKGETFNLVYLGGISKLKGAHVILNAMVLLKNENVRLTFVQFNVPKHLKKLNEIKDHKRRIKYILGIDYETNILKLIEEHNLWDYIDFYPTVTNPETFISESDVVIFPASSPHQSRPVYEAGAAKKPIIITDFKQTSEFAIDGFNCLTFQNENHKELAEKILVLKNNQELYKEVSENNYRLSFSKHNLANLGMELDEMFSRL